MRQIFVDIEWLVCGNGFDSRQSGKMIVFIIDFSNALEEKFYVIGWKVNQNRNIDAPDKTTTSVITYRFSHKLCMA